MLSDQECKRLELSNKYLNRSEKANKKSVKKNLNSSSIINKYSHTMDEPSYKKVANSISYDGMV